MNAPPAGGGLLASLRRLVASGLELAQVRLELLSTEIEQEKLRLFEAFIWAAVGLLLLVVGVVLAIGTLALMLQDAYRLPVLAVLSLALLAAAAWLLRLARGRLRRRGLFSASVAELSRDRQALGPDGSDGHAG